ncbi:MAG TPA: uroporphyrinogen-III synthase [Chitinophagaceae bacterium]|nr:uroporphyrinogen-III synthase [Chitinophagaceae bacterium]
MQQNNISILSTRPLPANLVEEAESAGIRIDELSFIETEPLRSVETQQEIEQAFLQSTTVVFTSMNAVDAVAAEKEEQHPDWEIYCTGQATQQLVKHYFGEENIAGTADSAAELAELIVEESKAEEVIFFCGDQRREELPSILRNHDLEVNEIVVYHTIAVPHKINQEYQGILFFSPSAVDSFFRLNKLPSKTILFAIGKTTEAQIRKYTTNTIIRAEEPGKENLLLKAIEYFT